MKFIHTSDWQIGMTRAFLSQEAGARFAQARIDAITTIGDIAREHGAAFIVVAGDVFESNQLSRSTVARALDAIAALPVPVFLLPGNHDPLDASSIFQTDAFSTLGDHVQVIRDGQPIPVPGQRNTEIVGAPWRSKRPATDQCAEVLAALSPANDTRRVFVGHGQTDNLAPDHSQPGVIALSALEDALSDGRVDFIALGDRHSVTRVGSSGRIWYSGAPLATDFDETDPNQCLLVNLDSAEVMPLACGDWRFLAIQQEINADADVRRFHDWLDALPDKARSIVKVGFTGTVNLATAADLDACMEEAADAFASLRRRDRTTDLAVVPDTLDENAVALGGYAAETWRDLLAAAEQDSVAQDALRLMYRLAGGNAQQ